MPWLVMWFQRRVGAVSPAFTGGNLSTAALYTDGLTGSGRPAGPAQLERRRCRPCSKTAPF